MAAQSFRIALIGIAILFSSPGFSQAERSRCSRLLRPSPARISMAVVLTAGIGLGGWLNSGSERGYQVTPQERELLETRALSASYDKFVERVPVLAPMMLRKIDSLYSHGELRPTFESITVSPRSEPALTTFFAMHFSQRTLTPVRKKVLRSLHEKAATWDRHFPLEHEAVRGVAGGKMRDVNHWISLFNRYETFDGLTRPQKEELLEELLQSEVYGLIQHTGEHTGWSTVPYTSERDEDGLLDFGPELRKLSGGLLAASSEYQSGVTGDWSYADAMSILYLMSLNFELPDRVTLRRQETVEWLNGMRQRLLPED